MNLLLRILIWPLLIGLLLSAIACKQATEPVQPETPGSFVPSFEGVRWQITNIALDPAIDIDGDGRLDSDITNLLFRPCYLDNTLVFEHGGKLSSDNGKLTCDDDEPVPVKPSTWTYDSTTKKLRIIDGDNPAEIMEWSVIEASTRYLKVKTVLVEEGSQFGIVMTWKAA
ncbi:hypothetical protein A6C57_24055 [Fibrella sp. ES10-3-2-2]|nr:hypothetical protein A6C57_24055 [Fibrella sp. ES10-3-2-2]